MHFRTIDDKALAAALSCRGVSEQNILSDKNGWTSLYCPNPTIVLRGAKYGLQGCESGSDNL
jgi:hypothetical protein